jgi:hypothetical protein
MSILRVDDEGKLDMIMGVRLGLGSLGHELNDAVGRPSVSAAASSQSS